MQRYDLCALDGAALRHRAVLTVAMGGWRAQTQLKRIEQSLVLSAISYSVRRLYHKAMQGWVQQLNGKRRQLLRTVSLYAPPTYVCLQHSVPK